MWYVFLFLSVLCPILVISSVFAANRSRISRLGKISLFYALFAGVFVSSIFMFIPIHMAGNEKTLPGILETALLSVFNSIQVFAAGCEFGVVKEPLVHCPAMLSDWYQAWISLLFVVAPVFTFGFVLSLFKNISAYCKYICAFFKDVYVFSELNEKSLVFARNVKDKHRGAAIVFTDVFEDGEEASYELIESAKDLGAICFKKDILAVNFKLHSFRKSILFFTIGEDQTENLNHSLKLIEHYKARKNTHLFVFSIKIESELLLTTVDKGEMKVRRINEVQSRINRILYDEGEVLFEGAKETNEGFKQISAVIVGMGRHGTEMLKALTWFGQMDGYRLKINAFDRDPLAKERFIAKAPELMSPLYNGVIVDGEAQYTICIHPDTDVESVSFAEEISKISDATYVFVALGNDDVNINTAVSLRMYFERMKIHPTIYAVVYNSQQKKALTGIHNYRGQSYDIKFIGDIESSYSEDVIIDSELEEDALKRHLKWGKEEEFWDYEYNYRSSMASAIHMKARIKCKIPGADKREEDLTETERLAIQTLEHRRWNAYMRAEGYVFSGSKDKSSRNDLGKMHHDLVDFASLSEEEKRKDSSVGTL